MSNCTESHGYVFSVSIVIKNRNIYNNRIMYIKSVLEVHDIIQGPRRVLVKWVVKPGPGREF